MVPSPSVLFRLLVSRKTPQSNLKRKSKSACKLMWHSMIFIFFPSLCFLIFSCGPKVKPDVDSDESGRGKQAHGEMRGDGEPSPHLQVVQRWQRAEEKQKSPNKERPVSTSHPCLVNLTTVRDEKERRCS